MSDIPKPDVDLDRSNIAALRNSWIEAVNRGDPDRLATFVTDDFVAIDNTGRCICGKARFKQDLENAFELYDVDRKVAGSEVIVLGRWAIEIDDMTSTATPVQDGAPIRARMKNVLVFARQADSSWKVARIIQLLG